MPWWHTPTLPAPVLARTDHLVRSGAVAPTVRDGLAAATLLARLEAERPAFDEDDFLRASFVFLDAAEEVLPDEMRQAMFERINSHPATQELSQRWEQLQNTAPRFKSSSADAS